MRIAIAAGLGLLVLLTASAAAAAKVWSEGEKSLEVFGAVQIWDVTTFGAVDDQGNRVDDRTDVLIRRGRLGVRGQVRDGLEYRVWFAYDQLGKNAFDGASGTGQASANKEFYLWDAFATLRLRPGTAYLTAGYFRPQVGRESITSPFKIDSFNKALGNTYTRAYMVGRGSGRETGIDLGGLLGGQGLSLDYNLGLFDTNDEKINGAAAGGGIEWAPLLTARVAVSLGDPELKKYGINYQTTWLGKRKGVTLAVFGSHQGRTNQSVTEVRNSAGELTGHKYYGGFDRNEIFGGDLLLNWGPLDLDAEWAGMRRAFSDAFAAAYGLPEDFQDTVWHVRGAWNFPLPNGQVLQPAAMYSRFDGEQDSLLYPDGQEKVLEFGLNWYLDGQSWFVNAFYDVQDGRPVSRFARNAKEDKGDLLGLGMTFTF